jgi:hypothetical protein
MRITLEWRHLHGKHLSLVAKAVAPQNASYDSILSHITLAGPIFSPSTSPISFMKIFEAPSPKRNRYAAKSCITLASVAI